MLCTDTPPADATEWVELAGCLDRRRMHEAAAVAWRRAWEAEPDLAPRVLEAAVEHAHHSGNDTLLVEVALTLDELDAEVDGHVLLAAERWGEVPEVSCRYPVAQTRLAETHAAAGRLKSQVMALREVMSWTDEADLLDVWPRSRIAYLSEAALLQVAEVYLDLGRTESGRQYLEAVEDGMRPRDALRPWLTWLQAWAAFQDDQAEAALALADEVIDVVPDASLVAVAAAGDLDERKDAAEAAHTRLEPLRDQLVALTEVPPAEVRQALLASEVPRDGWGAVGANTALLPLWVRAYEVDREARRARRSAVVAELVVEADATIEVTLGEGIQDLARDSIDRIDATLARADLLASSTVPRAIWPGERTGTQHAVPPKPRNADGAILYEPR